MPVCAPVLGDPVPVCVPVAPVLPAVVGCVPVLGNPAPACVPVAPMLPAVVGCVVVCVPVPGADCSGGIGLVAVGVGCA